MRHQRLETQHPALVTVEPYAFASGRGMERAVQRDELAVDIGLGRQAAQESHILRRQARPGPGDRARGGIGKIFGCDPAAHREIVIAGDAKRVSATDQRNALGRLAVIADDAGERRA